MSKNYKAYNQCSKNVDSSPVEETVETVVADEVEETVSDVVEEPTTQETKETVTGVVTGCDKLRVRKSPNPNASVLCEISAGAPVVIEDSTNAEFYKVVTETGVDGYCMKTYITILEN